MRTFLLLSLVLAIAQCQDYTCPKGKSKPKKIMLSPGDSYTFNGNNDGDSYFPKTKCAAIYKAHKKCKDGIRVSCDGFDLPNRDASRCRKGDRLILGKKAYCQTNSPDPITLRGKAAKKGLRVMFISDKKSQGDGPVCTAECLDGAAATTTAPTTSSEQCGPESCGLTCGNGTSCVQNSSLQCLTSPCCPQWSCQTCPEERPDFQSKCGADLEGLKCEYGSQVCCRETYPEIKMTCISGRWEGYYVDTVCMIADHQCPTSTTPESCICPAVVDPVCGSNNVTYSNSCQASCEQGVEVNCKGECPCPDCLCIEIFAPVCGADGKTYGNSCKAGCARVEVACEGECPCSE